jgi:hypothetical protein
MSLRSQHFAPATPTGGKAGHLGRPAGASPEGHGGGGRNRLAHCARAAPILQVMAQKPSATAEGYRPRSVDALRPLVAQIEAHVLKLAGVTFQEELEPGKLRAVK